LRALQTTISGKTRAAPKGPNDLSWEDQFAKLGAYADRLGLRSEMENLNVIHVAGTKGKGSTCAFVEHILRENGVKTGLYTSPHLVDIRERFRVNGVPVSKQKFTQQFWWLFNKVRVVTFASTRNCYLRHKRTVRRLSRVHHGLPTVCQPPNTPHPYSRRKRLTLFFPLFFPTRSAKPSAATWAVRPRTFGSSRFSGSGFL